MKIGEEPARCCPALALGPNRLRARVDEEGEVLTISMRVQLPDATERNELHQDLLQVAKLFGDAEKFVKARKDFFVGQVRERLQTSGVRLEPGLLRAELVCNHRRMLDWKERAVAMHARLLMATEKLTRKQARAQAAAAAEKAFQKAPDVNGKPTVQIKGV